MSLHHFWGSANALIFNAYVPRDEAAGRLHRHRDDDDADEDGKIMEVSNNKNTY